MKEDLEDGLEAIKSLSFVESSRIGVIGFSLGGYFSLILATRDDVRGSISFYGGYQQEGQYSNSKIIAQIKAPLLMFHGDADKKVPIDRANDVKKLLDARGAEYEYIVYPGVGHAFNMKLTPTFDEKATANAQEKVLDFLKVKLQQ